MVVKDINENAGGMSEVTTEPCPAPVNDRVRIGEAIDALMLLNTAKEVHGHVGAITSFDEIRQQVAEADLNIRFR